ncbi:ABC transporter permease [Mycoplasmopsis opalescens]|uniref:ABC transporter permease n=1 Tax=Mycoplasmopsis opalescens TaxID=114886 RepID=UPI0004A738C7|nr:ABC transporter permease subunit [Mycoplasmopsis opalescens]
MSKALNFLKSFYVHIILLLVYIPLFFAVIFSFNKTSDKDFLSFSWNGVSDKAWKTFLNEGRAGALLNSIIIALITAIIVSAISLVTVYALYRQKNRAADKLVKTVTQVSLINPDNIIAIGLVLVFALFVGGLSNITGSGLYRGIIAHTVMALPYGITLMYPRSEKFNNYLFEASMDLGYNKIRSWFKTYFVHMLPSIIFAALVAMFLSFDDFIIIRTTTNVSTLGTKLYSENFKSWGLVIGAILLFITLTLNVSYISYKIIKLRKKNKLLKAQYNGGFSEKKQ